MHIDAYSFGRIVIEGKAYVSDVIIYPHRVAPSWWREQGHLLQKADLKDVIAAKPDILVVGTGAHGLMHVPEGTIRLLQSQGIKLYIDKTAKAVDLFNRQSEGKSVIGVFHLTC